MKKINEIFYSLQGEGFYTGTAAVFVRFSGCNLKCSFCDTQHQEGEQMTDEQILHAIQQYPTKTVIFTGGEPSLQVDSHLCQLLHQQGYTLHVETNGTRELPAEIDWITCSPKMEFCQAGLLHLEHIDELKVVFTSSNSMATYESIPATHYFIQPCDTGDAQKNQDIQQAAIDYCLKHPKWRLSLQTHKILQIR